MENNLVISAFYTIFLLFVVGGVIYGIVDLVSYQRYAQLRAAAKRYAAGRSRGRGGLLSGKGMIQYPLRTIEGIYNAIYPEEFREGYWPVKAWHYLWTRHSLLKLFAAESRVSINSVTKTSRSASETEAEQSLYPPNRDYRLFYWLYATTKILSLWFVSVVIVYIFYPDEAHTCEDIGDQNQCESQQTGYVNY